MSSRLALESWQLLFPAIGIAVFAAVFFGVVIWVWRMKSPAVDHLGHLPLEEESVAGPGTAPPRVDTGSLPAVALRGCQGPAASLDSHKLNPDPETPTTFPEPSTHVR